MRPPWIWRPAVSCRCGYGTNLAGVDEFAAQAASAQQCFDWDRSASHLVKRLESGRTPLILDLFCCAGGVSEGFRRAGGTSFGVDVEDQVEYRARFGERWFKQGDALDREMIRYLVRKYRPVAIWASPPCEASSTATFGGGHHSNAPRLIARTRDMLEELGLPYVIENVQGASSELRGDALVLRGQDFGLETERPRLFEAGGGLTLRHDPFLAEGGAALRARCCLGAKARYAKLDCFGRRLRVPCCQGNIYPVMGQSPSRSSLAENARAMAIDVGHMSFARMAKAIPPAYSAFIHGSIMRHVLWTKYGLRVPSWREAQADLPKARRDLAFWMRGGGGPSPSMGVEFYGPENSLAVGETPTQGEVMADEIETSSSDRPSEISWSPTLEGSREIELSFAGGCDGSLVSVGSTMNYSDLRPVHRVTLSDGTGEGAQGLAGLNVLVHVVPSRIKQAAAVLRDARDADRLTRAVIVCLPEDEVEWVKALGEESRVSWVMDLGGRHSVTPDARKLVEGAHAARVLSFGERECLETGARVDRLAVAALMDPVDSGSRPPIPKAWKRAVAHSPYPDLLVENWEGKGFPPHILDLVRNGARIEPFSTSEVDSEDLSGDCVDPRSETRLGPGCFVDEHGVLHRFKVERGQYTFPDQEHFEQGVTECDRAMLVGHLEPVPASMVDEALTRAPAHPWSIVHQSEDKWRAAQDYSCFTNDQVGHKPFTLPSVWDAASVVTEHSHFAKFDLRDGFWAVKVEEGSRPLLMVRHPATGRLLWCRTLPFGYKLSPLIFCGFTEAVGDVFRQRVAGLGIHLFVYVDDFLIVGDTRELTIKGMEVLQSLLDELGLHWAAHKRRGPARAMEFLGFLLVNDPLGVGQLVAMTEQRQARITSMIEEWMVRRPHQMAEIRGAKVKSGPKELASLLGHLVFAAEVVPNGRTYMQGMLRQFVGLEVDWAHGRVRHAFGAWGKVDLTPAFWRDLTWWRGAIGSAHCKPMHGSSIGEAAISGTDASDFACGELVWLDGAREELRMVFTQAEKRRPINFRELLGVYRLIERWGPRLVGRTLLIDIDNSATVGATSKLYSKAEDMQELVRRIVELSARHHLTIRPVHTPGAMLHRPDQTSRGAAVEEPRCRFRKEEFRVLECAHGPFTDLIGAERAFARTVDDSKSRSTLWAHPTHDTVATALSRIGERLTTSLQTCPRGLVVVPWAPEAPWWRLTRHFSFVASTSVGSRHLEENRGGRWVRISARRPSLVLAFPRHLGTVKKVSCVTTDGEGDESSRTLPKGSVLYAPVRGGARALDDAAESGEAGTLYQLLEDYSGEGRPKCAEFHRPDKRAQHGTAEFILDLGKDSKQGLSLAAGNQPWEVDPRSLWVANHFVTLGITTTGGRHGAGTLSLRFGVTAAEREIAARSLNLSRMRVIAGLHQPKLEHIKAELEAGLSGPADVALPMSGLRAREGEGDSQSEPSGVAEEAQADRGQEHLLMGEGADRSDSVGGGDEMAQAAQLADETLGTARAAQSAEPAGETLNEAIDRIVDSMSDSLRRDRDRARRAEGARPQRPKLSVSGQPLVAAGYEGMRCAGCDEAFAIRSTSRVGAGVTKITPGGTAMIHDRMGCLRAARRKMEAEALLETRAQPDLPVDSSDIAMEDPPLSSPAADMRSVPRAETAQKAQQLADKQSEPRRRRVRLCLKGDCGELNEEPMVCRGLVAGAPCEAKLHGRKCAQLPKGLAELGCFLCPDCRFRAMNPGSDDAISDQARGICESAMLIEMSTGAEATGASYSDFKNLEREFMEAVGATGPNRVMPSDNAEVFKTFLNWLVNARDRALSLESIFRAAGAYMAKTTRTNLTKDAGVKAIFKDLCAKHGKDRQPCTAITRRMVKCLLHDVVTAGTTAMRARERLLFGGEIMMGVRVGEMLEGGDKHGLLANNLVILRKLDGEGNPTGEETLEGMFPHTKSTKVKRYVNCVGTSRGPAKVPMAQILRDYWEAAGFKIVKRKEAGFLVEGPSYFVVRVSLVALTDKASGDTTRLDLLERTLKASKVPAAAQWAKYSRYRGGERMNADSLDKKYINVLGTDSPTSPDSDTLINELAKAGFDEPGRVTIAEGPLMRATNGSRLGLSNMPLSVSATYAPLHKYFAEAYRLANPADDPDMELDLQGRDTPKFGHHSDRRGADTIARAFMNITGATPADIDLTFGWNEKVYQREMQRHYESSMDRQRRCAVTSMM